MSAFKAKFSILSSESDSEFPRDSLINFSIKKFWDSTLFLSSAISASNSWILRNKISFLRSWLSSASEAIEPNMRKNRVTL